VSQLTLDAMTDAMIHRGPDDRGTYVADGAAIGARRLSIIDVADGHQPFADESGRIWAAQNGEIFNHDLLRAELSARGHRFATRCDTEILPHLYEEHGFDFGSCLRGMFAVALWDERNDRGVLVRDRLGIKPLYYAERDGLLLFSSELKGLLASGLVDAEIDPEALEIYLTLGMVPAPRTLLRGVFKLPPGHRIEVASGRVSVERYWSFPEVAGLDPTADVAEHSADLLEGLRDSVRMRLMSDVPLGAMLSGGLDSSLIVALMADQMAEPVKTFAVGFAGSATSELADAREVAARFGADHHELEVDEGSVAGIDELVWHMDEPLADLSALGFLELCRLARTHVTVALSGQGADELFAGYQHHLHAPLVRSWERVPSALRRPLLALAGRGPKSARRFAEVVGARDAVDRAIVAKRIASDGEVSALLNGRGTRGVTRSALTAFVGVSESEPLAGALAIDAQLGLPDDMLHYFDRGSMAHSLEVRVPFLDHDFVERAAAIPANLKLHGRTTKHVLREAARGLVPDHIIDKPKIGFFNASMSSWIASALEHDAADVLLGERPLYGAYLDRRVVVELVDAQRTRPTPRRAQLLLAILLFEAWLQTYLPRAQAGAHHTSTAAAAVAS
jgi:asparagine synthase (glutamine-hydrolysing)